MDSTLEDNVDGSMEDDGVYQEWNGPTISLEGYTTDDLPPSFQLHANSKKVEKVRLKLYETVLKGSCEDVRKVLKEVHTAGNRCAESVMLDPRNDMNVLHLALDRKRRDIANILISECDSEILKQVFTLPIGSRTALHQITEAGDETLVKKVLNQINEPTTKIELVHIKTEFQVEDCGPRFINALHLAAFKGFTKIVKLFLDIGVDVNIRTKKGNTALQWAAREGHIDTIQCLLDNHADANTVSVSGSTALDWAVRGNQTESVKLLLEKGGADPNYRKDIGLGYPIITASSIGNSVMVDCLIKHGARINISLTGKQSALYHAAKGGHTETVNLLLKKKPDITVEDKDGNNALLIAAKKNCAQIVMALLANDDDVTHTNNSGKDIVCYSLKMKNNELLYVIVDHLKRKHIEEDKLTPLILTASRLGVCDKMKALIDMGVDPLRKGVGENTFIHYAALHNQVEVIKNFSEYVNINAQNKDGDTALHVACKAGNLLAVKELISQRARKGLTNNNNENILHAAASSKKTSTIELCKFLVENFIKEQDWDSLNSKNNKCENALHIAASFADPDVIWEFRKIRYKDQDNKGNTPFHNAVRPGCEEALDMMLKIYTKTDRDANLNIQNKNDETVLHLAVSARFKDTVIRLIENGADLGCQDKLGNTVLHRLVKATIEDMENDELYLQVVDSIFDKSVLWWCKKERINIPTEDQVDKHIELHRQAIMYLLHEYSNTSKESVVGYAFKQGADKFLRKVLTLENVTHVKIENNYFYDITYITPSTSEGKTRSTCRFGYLCDNVSPSASPSNMERILKCDAFDRVDRVLDIPPINTLESMYSDVCKIVYTILLVLHIIYMGLFTYVGISISTKFQELASGKLLDSNDHVFFMMKTVILIEPVLYTVNAFNGIIRLCKHKEALSKFTVLNLIIATLNPLITLSWIALVVARSYYQDYVLAVTLCIGWIASISLIRFKPVNFLYRLLLHIVLWDISRLLLVFAFVWLGFGAGFHVMMRFSPELSETYNTPFGTLYMLFTIVVGMFEIKDDWATSMEAENRNATFMKGFALVYIMLGTVIMMNLLIAMMTDSYKKILDNQQIIWRIDTFRIGIELEYILPKRCFLKSTKKEKFVRNQQHECCHILIQDKKDVNKPKCPWLRCSKRCVCCC